MAQSSKRPELLAPAGNLEKLKWAVQYGADAVYFGSEYSLRNFAGNFSLAQAEQGIKYLHRFGRKAYITLNIFPFSDEYDKILSLARNFDEMNADAIIVADLGVLMMLKREGIRAAVHISTQANTLSSQTALEYAELGASRVNLARELSLQQIKAILPAVSGKIQTEVFIHGAVCFSYSGRCAISDYLTGRRANRGECTHPCRWKYHLMEEERPGEYHPVFEDDRGLYFFNSKDLALFEYVPALAEIGVDSMKIEGRMKSVHYIGSVVSLYRRIIDGDEISSEEAFKLLGRVKNRGYSRGFIDGPAESKDCQLEDNHSTGGTVFAANVTDQTSDNGCFIRVRNKIFAGEKLEVLLPNGRLSEATLPKPLTDQKGETHEFANNEQIIRLTSPLPEFSILRRVSE
ncbi:putative protease YhbU precursor [Sedimentisphaera cyanobacteriorum]|uniref:Putative protease YhbU n=1 Tax=Sedimentisphaera cyanobacteriorum TaxID=1940790 RepID=A0A1Q2HM51_9BACT|nr:U32 family peptidase [Sedimentisphaera cyanobacteriorum]AQQ08334.1 putative protease YhbU precursor [Sedimentisphaera cyanobacteriorum]